MRALAQNWLPLFYARIDQRGQTLTPDDFITRWQGSGGSERANFQQFAIELTQLLGVPAPKPATADAQNDD